MWLKYESALIIRKESSWRARQLEQVISERNHLDRQLDAAKRELKSLKTCSLSWVREGSKVARVQETLATPRRRYDLLLHLTYSTVFFLAS